MIASVRGEVLAVAEDSIVVDVNGIGLRVYVTAAQRSELRPGEPVFLHTHMVMREDGMWLYGFETEAERSAFVLLLGANGVGPKMAMGILSVMNVEALRRAVFSEQADLFARVPGVGKKTAQKILLHLQGRMGQPTTFEGIPAYEVDTEVLDALTALGYSVVEAQAALQSLPKSAPRDLEGRLRAALQYFSG